MKIERRGLFKLLGGGVAGAALSGLAPLPSDRLAEQVRPVAARLYKTEFTSITITNGGSGYTTIPNITFVGGGGGT